MAKSSVSAMDAEILKKAFLNEVRHNKMPEGERRELAAKIVRAYTGSQTVDPKLVDWMCAKMT
ncbi:hypothetical protein CK218_27575 [Mesorhizobium sp. WSM3879]|nr:hypothetical protein CK218_27575 [Mesorhizobium sp. WSM3879]